MLYDELTQSNDYICHYGVKGQKWGVRKYLNSNGSLNKHGKKRLRREVKSNSKSYGKLSIHILDKVSKSKEGQILSLYDDGESGEAIPNYFREKAYGIGKPPKRYYEDWNIAYNNFMNRQSQILTETLGDLSNERMENGKTYLEYFTR